MPPPTSQDSLTIPGFDPELRERLRARAARNGQSVQAEALLILQSALAASDGPSSSALHARIRARFAALGGVDIVLSEREPARDPPDFT